MLDGVRLLSNVSDQNTYTVKDYIYILQDYYPVDFYVQLWQSDIDLPYIPSSSAVVEIQFLRSNTLGTTPESQSQILQAEAPFADKSIWKVPLSKAVVDKIVTGGVRVVVYDTIPGQVKNIAGAGVPGVSRSGNVVTVTTLMPHYFDVDQEVEVAGVSDATFDGTFTITEILSATEFTYDQVGIDASSGGGTVEDANGTEVKYTVWSNMSIRKVPSDQFPINEDA